MFNRTTAVVSSALSTPMTLIEAYVPLILIGAISLLLSWLPRVRHPPNRYLRWCLYFYRIVVLLTVVVLAYAIYLIRAFDHSSIKILPKGREHERQHHDARPPIEPFIATPAEYTESRPPCTAYTRQDFCLNDPPINDQPLPPCGKFSDSTTQGRVRPFLIIGDWGHHGRCQQLVANLARKLEKQFGRAEVVLGLGDSAYWDATCEDLRNSFQPGSYFAEWLDPAHISQRLAACRTPKVDEPFSSDQQPIESLETSADRYYPVLGNHDWDHWYKMNISTANWPYYQVMPYLRTAAAQSNQERRPDVTFYSRTFFEERSSDGVSGGGLHIVALNSKLKPSSSGKLDRRLNDMYDEQFNWFKSQRSISKPKNRVDLVLFHRPPFSSAQHDPPGVWMDLEYESMGFDAVLFGHQHAYERLKRNRPNSPSASHPTIPYILNGLGGHPWLYDIHTCPAYPGSQVRYDSAPGLQLGLYHWDENQQRNRVHLCFYSAEGGGRLVDQVTIG